VQSDTGEQHQLNIVKTRFLRIVAGLITAAFLFQAVLFSANLRTRWKAERLLESLRRLRVGSSTFADAQPVLSGYHAEEIPSGSACPSADAAYGVRISNNLISGLGSHLPDLLWVGVRPWGFSAVLSFKAGTLCAAHYSASLLLPRDQYAAAALGDLENVDLVELSAETTVQQHLDTKNYEIRSFQTLLRGFRKNGRYIGLQVMVTPDAAQSEIDHALAFDLSCLASLRGCRALCQLLPLAFEDALRNVTDNGVAELRKEEQQIAPCRNP